MRDWFPNFNWPDLIVLVLMTAGLCVLGSLHDPGIIVRDAAVPMALIVAYVVFWRWRRH